MSALTGQSKFENGPVRPESQKAVLKENERDNLSGCLCDSDGERKGDATRFSDVPWVLAADTNRGQKRIARRTLDRDQLT